MTVRAVRRLVRGSRRRARHPRAGRGEIAQDFAFHGNSAANRLRNFHDHGPYHSAARTTRTERARAGLGAKARTPQSTALRVDAIGIYAVCIVCLLSTAGHRSDSAVSGTTGPL